MPTNDHDLIIGIDGGGSGCRVAIGNQACGVIARAEGGPANAASDFDGAVKNITEAVNIAAADAGIPSVDLKNAAAHAGLAGVISNDDRIRIADALPYKFTTVTDDRATTVEGALDSRDGFVVSIGTGAILAARKGKDVRYVGGRGFYLSDQGAGGWLGRAALSHVLLCEDEIETHCDLTTSLLEQFDNDPVALVRFSVTARPADYAAFAPDIINAAQNGNVYGQSLMHSGASFLLRGLGALGIQGGDPLCFVGGIGPHYAPYFPNDILQGRLTVAGNALDGAYRLASQCVRCMT